jgi:HSP20 family protein
MSIIRWNAYRGGDTCEREINRMLESYFPLTGRREENRTAVDFIPVADVLEGKDGYTITLELPGVAKEEVKVDLAEDVLTVKGEKKIAKETQENGYCTERAYGTFSRSFQLPKDVEGGNVKAEFKDGVLTLQLPKSERAQAIKKE